MAKKSEHNKAPTSEDVRLNDEKIWTLVNEIHDLVKIRSALNFGTKTGTKDSAESVLSRAINAKVNILGSICIKKFDE
jgi:hypothetical protein